MAQRHDAARTAPHGRQATSSTRHRATTSRALRPAMLLGLAMGALAVTAPEASLAQPAQAAVPRQAYAVPAGTLDQVLTRFAAAAGLELSVDAALTRDRQSTGLAGSFTVQEGFAQLLRGHGLQAVRGANGAYSLRPAATPANGPIAATGAAPVLPVVRVSASVEGEVEGGPFNGYVARRGTTATKTDTPLLEIPQSISVIGTDELDDKGVTTLTDALAQTPGVAVNPYGFDARAPDWVMLRGFDGWYTSSYRDGLVQTVGLTFLGVQTEVYGLERLEVLRGPSSVLFGKGDVGGVVNRVSKLPGADAPREVMLQVGSYDRRQLAVDVGGALDAAGAVRYRLVGVGLDTGTQEKYPDGTRLQQERRYAAPSLRWAVSADTTLTLQAEVLRDDASDDIQYVTGADGQPTDVKEGDPRYSRIETHSDSAGYQLEHRMGEDWTLRQKMRHAYRTLDKHHILSWLDDDGLTLQRQARHDVESVREWTVDTSVSGRFQTAAASHTVLVGLDWDRSRAAWSRRRDMTTPLDMAHPVYGIDIAPPTTLVADTEVTSNQWGLYLQDQVRFGPHWGLTVGLRHDRVTSDTDDRFNAATATQTDRATTGRVGLSYQVGNGWAPYLGYAESFVPNVGVDAAGEAFQPSNGRQVELGAKYMPEGLPLSFAVAVFNLEKTDVLTYDVVTYEARQIGKVRSRGLELEAKAALSKQLRLTSSFTALDMKVLASANTVELGHMPILTPRRTGSLWLDYAVAGETLAGLSMGAGLRHVGKRWNDEANTSSEPAYTLVDAAVRYDTGPWRLALNVSNLFDKQYYSGRAYGSYFRGADRNLLLTAKYRF